MKKLVLAAIAALSLGLGAAQAVQLQNGNALTDPAVLQGGGN
jgi:hypothetical protein